ncbi:MAG: NfeD family protein [Serpentinimonas sp.]|nr:MAG: hypothetical protein JM57_10425 [Comamonadaceae bacterium BICA1-1]MDO8274150.1 NfeD family protein [Serpentinimonas sp.]MDO9612156.1 NfeD family protein [Serpentinimonas sp.]
MADWTIWWLLAGAAVVLELLTGTFFLLMLAVGLVAGALAAHAGLDLTGQLLSAAAVGGGAVAIWQRWRARYPTQAAAGRNPNINLDIGQSLTVEHWNPDGTAQVRYRGADWAVQFQGDPASARPGRHTIVELQGNTLLLSPSAVAPSAISK